MRKISPELAGDMLRFLDKDLSTAQQAEPGTQQNREDVPQSNTSEKLEDTTPGPVE